MKHLDLSTALVLLAASCVLTLYSYKEAVRSEQPRTLIGAVLRAGTSLDYVVARQQCVGSFSTTVETRAATTVRSKGSLDLRRGGKVFPATVSFEAVFNPLGQLTESSTRLAFEDSVVQLKSVKVNPMTLTLTAALAGANFAKVVKAAGPVSLRKTGNGAFTVDYAPLAPYAGESLRGYIESALARTRFSVVSDPQYHCVRGNGALEAGALLDALGRYFSPHTLPGGMHDSARKCDQEIR